MPPTVSETLIRSREKYPGKEAIVYPEKDVRMTYEEFDDTVSRFANVLERNGIEKGDRVAVLLRNSAEYAISIFAITRIGAIFAPINWRLAYEETKSVIEDADPDLLVFDQDVRDVVTRLNGEADTVSTYVFADDDRHSTPEFSGGFHRQLGEATASLPDVEVDSTDPYAIIYTSGTTGRPKGAVHTHENAVTHNAQYIWYWGHTHNSVGIVTKPLFHTAAIHCRLFPQVNVGATTIIMRDLDPKRLLQLVDEEGATGFALPSHTYHDLLEVSEEVEYEGRSMKRYGYGTSPMAPALLDRCIEVFGDEFSTAYGMTELGPSEAFLLPEDLDEKLGSVGVPAPNTDIRIVSLADGDEDDTALEDRFLEPGETGEIVIRSPCLMKEYWRKPKLTEESITDGWFFTGDVGYLDQDGFLYLVDRVDNMIISGGENIYPNEVEDILYQHPAIADAAVLGVVDDKWGETVKAYVVTSETVTGDELDEFIKDNDELADYKRPRQYEFLPELPRNPSGKILKNELREDS